MTFIVANKSMFYPENSCLKCKGDTEVTIIKIRRIYANLSYGLLCLLSNIIINLCNIHNIQPAQYNIQFVCNNTSNGCQLHYLLWLPCSFVMDMIVIWCISSLKTNVHITFRPQCIGTLNVRGRSSYILYILRNNSRTSYNTPKMCTANVIRMHL